MGGGEGGGGEGGGAGGGEGGGGEGGGRGELLAEATANWPKTHTTAISRAMPCARGGGSSVRCLGHAVDAVGCQAPTDLGVAPNTRGRATRQAEGGVA